MWEIELVSFVIFFPEKNGALCIVSAISYFSKQQLFLQHIYVSSLIYISMLRFFLQLAMVKSAIVAQFSAE